MKIETKIFPIYNLKQHVLEETYMQLIKLVCKQI